MGTRTGVFYRFEGVPGNGGPHHAEFIGRNFVPLALDNYVPGGSASDRAFYAAVRAGINGFSYGTASGVRLDGGHNGLEFQKVVDQYRALPKEERTKIEKLDGPFEAGYEPPKPPRKGLQCVAYWTRMEEDGKGDFRRRQSLNFFYRTTLTKPCLTWNDALWITGKEWKSLVPNEPKKGAPVPFPDSLRRRLLRFYTLLLNDNAQAIRAGELRARTEEVSPEEIRIRVDGSCRVGVTLEDATAYWESHPEGDIARERESQSGVEMRFLGYLTFDRKKGEFKRFDVLGMGEGWSPILIQHATGAGYAEHVNMKPVRWPLGLAITLMPDPHLPRNRQNPTYAKPLYASAYWEGVDDYAGE